MLHVTVARTSQQHDTSTKQQQQKQQRRAGAHKRTINSGCVRRRVVRERFALAGKLVGWWLLAALAAVAAVAAVAGCRVLANAAGPGLSWLGWARARMHDDCTNATSKSLNNFNGIQPGTLLLLLLLATADALAFVRSYVSFVRAALCAVLVPAMKYVFVRKYDRNFPQRRRRRRLATVHVVRASPPPTSSSSVAISCGGFCPDETFRPIMRRVSPSELLLLAADPH